MSCYCQIAASVEQESGRMLSNKLGSHPTPILKKLVLAVNILVGLDNFQSQSFCGFEGESFKRL